jgi:nucleotide-binding universal stress UspA family protein
MPESIICMASHGPGRLPENLHTTVSAPVVRTAKCPVVLVGPHCDRLDPTYTSVIACVDDSPVAKDVVLAAAAWAEALGLDLWLVDTALRPDRVALQGDGPPNDAWEGGHLRNLALAVGETGAHAQWDVLHDADPAHPHHAIVDYVVRHPQALVMMGSHHHTPRQHLAHPSVVMQVTHHATNPIVVIPQASTQT